VDKSAVGHQLIAFANDAEIRTILGHVKVEPSPPKISKAREPPLWNVCDEADLSLTFTPGFAVQPHKIKRINSC
jgi:hypothetical protein